MTSGRHTSVAYRIGWPRAALWPDRPHNRSRRQDGSRRTSHRQRWPGRSHWSRSEEHTSELQSLMRISYAVFCLKKKKKKNTKRIHTHKTCKPKVRETTSIKYYRL